MDNDFSAKKDYLLPSDAFSEKLLGGSVNLYSHNCAKKVEALCQQAQAAFCIIAHVDQWEGHENIRAVPDAQTGSKGLSTMISVMNDILDENVDPVMREVGVDLAWASLRSISNEFGHAEQFIAVDNMSKYLENNNAIPHDSVESLTRGYSTARSFLIGENVGYYPII